MPDPSALDPVSSWLDPRTKTIGISSQPATQHTQQNFFSIYFNILRNFHEAFRIDLTRSMATPN
jgi:hypothetical protein